ncbi:MAG: hypothetical protein U0Z26_07295 [Anaerolineales bacterium]
MKNDNTKRRDWSLIIFILPIGILLMLLAGQLAIRMAPNWLIDGEINSNLDPETASKQQALVVRPVSNGILTPMSWWDTFLTPGADDGSGVSYPPFVIFVPTSTPTLKPTTTPVVTATSATPTVTASKTPTSTPTKKPTGETPSPTSTKTSTPTVTTTPTTCTDPLATNNGGPLPCTYPPTTCTDPLATNNGGPLPCTYPPTTCTDPLATNNGGPLPCVYPTPTGFPSTPDASWTPATLAPVVVIGTPVAGGPSSTIPQGSYTVINISGRPIVVVGTAETNYDLVYYETESLSSPGNIQLDNVILGISTHADGSVYYEVFNWGNGIPDTNTNVASVPENDNQIIPTTNLYSNPGTGILIDVDNATSAPPPDTYNYLVVIAPVSTSKPASESIDVGAVDVTEVSSPQPTP